MLSLSLCLFFVATPAVALPTQLAQLQHQVMNQQLPWSSPLPSPARCPILSPSLPPLMRHISEVAGNNMVGTRLAHCYLPLLCLALIAAAAARMSEGLAQHIS